MKKFGSTTAVNGLSLSVAQGEVFCLLGPNGAGKSTLINILAGTVRKTGGAARVYAVDSGTNQLAWKLRQDPRVVVHEQTSARILTAQHVPELIDLVVCDASFIGLAKVLDVPLGFVTPGGRALALIKPQFEAGREEVGKGGVVRDPVVHARVCAQVADWFTARGWSVVGITESPITGPNGNVEFLIAATLD